jgi:hypothetical protein
VSARRPQLEPMIYQLIIDGCRWRGSFCSPRLVTDDRSLARLRMRGIPDDVLRRLADYKDRIFLSQKALMRVVKRVLEPHELTAHGETIRAVAEGMAQPMAGSSRRRPVLDPRACLYFTDLGWETVGRSVAAQARRLGHVVKVRRHKRPAAARIVYADALHVAVLPGRNGVGRGKRRR